MNIGIKNKDLGFAFVALVTIASIDMWSFRSIEGFTYNAIEAFVLASLVLVVATRSGVLLRRGLVFKGAVLLLLLAPLPSVLGAAIYHKQDIKTSLYVNRYSLYWLLYFVLHIFKPDRERVSKLMIFAGAVWASLTIVQQFTYPHYWFYTRNDEKKSIYRAGVYRFSVAGLQYGLYMLIFYYYRYLNNERVKYALFTGFGLVGLYYYGTRQHALAAAGCMCIAVFTLKGISRWKNLLLIVGLAALALGLKEVLFGEYIEMTNTQLQYDDDIRMLAARFYFFDYWPDAFWSKIIGNGRPYGETSYGREMMLINTGLRYFRSDVGIIGSYNQYGLLYIVIVVGFLLKGLTFKVAEVENRYLKIFLFYFCMILVLNESFSSASTIPFFCLLLYQLDLIKQGELAGTESATGTDKVGSITVAAGAHVS